MVPLLGGALAFLGHALSGAASCAVLAIAMSLGVPSAMLVVSRLFQAPGWSMVELVELVEGDFGGVKHT